MKLCTAIGIVFTGFIALPLSSSAQSNLPKCREAVFVESFSPSEVNIRAKGLGEDVDAAESDAKKSAVYYVLYNAPSKILQTPAEEEAFSKVAETIFADETIGNYITFVGNDILSRVNTKDGVKVEKLVRVNQQRLIDDLSQQGIIASHETLTEAFGNPFIMVLPEVPKGQNPIAALQNSPNLKKGAEVIEGYLTSRKYDVQVPEQVENLSELADAHSALKGVEDDNAYKLALTIGADVYIVYNVDVQSVPFGKKGVVGCRAYETTTGRLLGTETGYSPEKPSSTDAALIEMAMNDAIEKVLTKINAYWKDDLRIGQQYKLIIKITGRFDDPLAVGDMFDDVLKGMTTKRKQNAATEKTVDYIIWQNQFENTIGLFRELSKRVEQNNDARQMGVKVKRLNVNRKMIILEATHA